MMRTCAACGAFVQPTWDRCKICGADRDAPRSPQSGAPAPPGAGGPRPGGGRPSGPGSSSGGPSPGGSSNRLVLVAAAVVVVLALGLGYVVLTSGGDDDGDDRIDFAAGADGDITTTDHASMCEDPEADPSAPAYHDEPSYHGIQIYVPDEEFPDRLARFRPDDPAWNGPTQLVACVTRTSSTFGETCTGYEGGRTVEAHDATYEIVVFAVHDGAEVTRGELESTDACPLADWFVEGESSTRYYRGPRGVDDFLRPIVAVPDASGVVPTSVPAEVDLPTPTDPACAQPPFSFQVRGGDGSERTVDLRYAYALEFPSEFRMIVVATDHPVDPDALTTALPPVPEGGTRLKLSFRPTSDADTATVDVDEGDVIETSVFTSASTYVDLDVGFGGPANASDRSGGVTVTHRGGDFLCLDVDLRSGTGVQAIGRLSAAVLRVDEQLFSG